jgi:hypothetical protein
MHINTERSIKLGESIYEEYGSWEAVIKAATLRDGVYVLPPKQVKPDQTKAEPNVKG